MWPDRVSNPGTLTYESGALPTARRAITKYRYLHFKYRCLHFKYRYPYLDIDICIENADVSI